VLSGPSQQCWPLGAWEGRELDFVYNYVFNKATGHTREAGAMITSLEVHQQLLVWRLRHDPRSYLRTISASC